jgi:hypothetical protein
VLKARRWLVLLAPQAVPVLPVRKAQSELPVPEASPWPVVLVQPDLPVMQARKVYPGRRANKAPLV